MEDDDPDDLHEPQEVAEASNEKASSRSDSSGERRTELKHLATTQKCAALRGLSRWSPISHYSFGSINEERPEFCNASARTLEGPSRTLQVFLFWRSFALRRFLQSRDTLDDINPIGPLGIVSHLRLWTIRFRHIWASQGPVSSESSLMPNKSFSTSSETDQSDPPFTSLFHVSSRVGHDVNSSFTIDWGSGRVNC